MWSMAPQASFRLDRGVLEYKGSARLSVALGADRILVGRRLQVIVPEGAMNIMTVAALNQAFVHSMMERHIEGRFHVGVALKAKHGLSSLQQLFLVCAAMDAVAACAADACLGMRGTFKVGMRPGVAAQARFVHFCGRCLGRIEDLRNVAASLHMRLARAMATLARSTALAMLECQLAVRIGSEPLRL